MSAADFGGIGGGPVGWIAAYGRWLSGVAPMNRGGFTIPPRLLERITGGMRTRVQERRGTVGTVTQLPGTRPGTPPINPNAPMPSSSGIGANAWWMVPFIGVQMYDIWATAQERRAREEERLEKEREKREREAEKRAEDERERKREIERDVERQDDRKWQATQRQWEIERHNREERERIAREAEERDRQRRIDQAPLSVPVITAVPLPYPTAIPAPAPAPYWKRASAWAMAHPELALAGLTAITGLASRGKGKKRKPKAQETSWPVQGLTYDQAPAVQSWPQTELATAKKCKPCRCKKPKKRGPRKPRSVCYKGSYVETSTGLRKRRREQIPC